MAPKELGDSDCSMLSPPREQYEGWSEVPVQGSDVLPGASKGRY
jgi:hypothetical protein